MSATLALVLVVLAFFLGFVAVPWLVLPRPASARNSLDAAVINFVRWTALVIAGGHVLMALRLFEALTLIAIILVGIHLTKLRPRGWTLARIREGARTASLRVVGAADRAEQRRRGPDEPMELYGPEEPEPTPVRAGRRRDPIRLVGVLLAAAPIIAVLAVSFWLRVEGSLQNAALSPPDNYVHLTWARAASVNQLFVDGVYPQGMPIIIAYLDKFAFGVDLIDTVRFFGPMIGTLIVFSVGYATLRLTRNPGAAILAAGAFGLTGMRPEWHEDWVRQTGTLPQELSLAVAVLGVTFLVLVVVECDRDHLWTIGAATLLLALTHPLPLGMMVVVGGGAALVTALFVHGGMRRALEAGGVAASGAVIGSLFLPVALLAGIPLYEGATNLNPFETSTEPGSVDVEASALPFELGHNVLTGVAAVGAALALTAGLVALARGRRTVGARFLGLAAISGIVLALYDPRVLPLDPFFTGRFANMVGPMVAIALGGGVGALVLIPLFRSQPLARAAVMVVAGLAALAVFTAQFPAEGPQGRAPIEYDSVVHVTRELKAQNERLEYTVVGTPEQAQMLGNHGWFVELWVFARDVGYIDEEFRASDGRPSFFARDPGIPLPIPTRDVYIVVEKEPFSEFTLPPRGATEEYYRNPDKRGRVMAVTYRWAEEYRRYHSDMTVHFDDDQVRVYRIRHAPNPEISEDSPMFEDYRWRPGQLFEEGPTSVREVDDR